MIKAKDKERFIVEFPLKTDLFHKDILNKRMEIGRRIYNQLVKYYKNVYTEMTRTKKYRAIQSELSDIRNGKEANEKSKKKRSPREADLYKELNAMYKEYGFTDYAMQNKALKQSKPFVKNIDSMTAQKIGNRLWKAWDKFLFSDGKNVHFCRYDCFNSMEGKSNKTGIRLKENYSSEKGQWKGEKTVLVWNGIEIPVLIDEKNPYEVMSMRHEIAYNRIVRRFVRGKYKFYVQIVFKGTPPDKIDKNTGEFKHRIGDGSVGLDIGTQTLAIASSDEVDLIELADRVQNIENKKRRINRKLDRSRRAMNPDNFNEDGTIKKQGNKKVIWHKSNHYKKLQSEKRELERKQAAVRKYQHYLLVNRIIELGDTYYVETMNYKGLQARAKKTEKNEKGKFKRKKRFGKSIANKAPSMFLKMLEQKAKQYGGELIKVHTQAVKASQYSHITDSYVKKKLSKRWDDVSGCQRDLYSAFLLMNMKDTETIDKEKCNETFKNFKELHDNKINELRYKDIKTPCSMGVKW